MRDLPPPTIDLTKYRVVDQPRIASRLNAVLVLVAALVGLLIVLLSGADARAAIFTVFGAGIGIALGWSLTRIISPKPLIVPIEDPLLQPPTGLRAFFAKPPGWDEPRNRFGRWAAAIGLGLVVYFIRTHH